MSESIALSSFVVVALSWHFQYPVQYSTTHFEKDARGKKVIWEGHEVMAKPRTRTHTTLRW